MELINIILITFSVIGFALLLYHTLRVDIEEAFACSPAAITILLFASAQIECLRSGAFIIYYSGIVSFLFYFLFSKTTRQILNTPSVYIILISTLAYWFIFKDTYLHYWDEFGHWGMTTKDMFFKDTLTNNEFWTRLKWYPPGSSLFHYFVTKQIGMTDGNIYFSHFFLFFYPTAVLYKKTTWNSVHKSILIVLATLLAIQVFGRGGLNKIYVDQIIGTVFGLGIIIAAKTTASWKDTILLAIIAFHIVLIKESAALYGALILCIFIMAKPKDSIRLLPPKKTLVSTVLIVIALAASIGLWKQHVAQLETRTAYGSSFSTQLAADIALGKASPYYYKVLRAFASAYSSHPINPAPNNERLLVRLAESLGIPLNPRALPKLHFLAWLACLGALAAYAWKAAREDKRGITSALVTLGIGLVIYQLGILYLQLFVFGKTEALRTASFARYNGSYLLGSCTALLFFATRSSTAQRAKSRIHIWILLFSVFIIFYDTPGLSPYFMVRQESNLILSMQKANAIIANGRTPNTKLMIVYDERHDNYLLDRYPRYCFYPHCPETISVNKLVPADIASMQATHVLAACEPDATNMLAEKLHLKPEAINGTYALFTIRNGDDTGETVTSTNPTP